MSVLPPRRAGRRLVASFRPPPPPCRAISWLMGDPLFQPPPPSDPSTRGRTATTRSAPAPSKTSTTTPSELFHAGMVIIEQAEHIEALEAEVDRLRAALAAANRAVA